MFGRLKCIGEVRKNKKSLCGWAFSPTYVLVIGCLRDGQRDWESTPDCYSSSVREGMGITLGPLRVKPSIIFRNEGKLDEQTTGSNKEMKKQNLTSPLPGGAFI